MADKIRLFVFGLGYSATAFARASLTGIGWVGGTVRSAEKARSLAGEGMHALRFDGIARDGAVAEAVAGATHILISIAPGEAGDPVLATYREDILAASNLRWIGYLSTIGVYGDYGGAWINERTIPHPSHDRSRERLKTEAAWRSLARQADVPLAIFRIAGIYGPGRNALVNLAEGKSHRIVKPGQVFNRIHVADIALTIDAAVRRGAGGIYNVSDDEPAPPQDVIDYAADLMGVAKPATVSLESAAISDMARSFYADNRRVMNRRIREELGVALRYPTYREGLSALWRSGTWRG